MHKTFANINKQNDSNNKYEGVEVHEFNQNESHIQRLVISFSNFF